MSTILLLDEPSLGRWRQLAPVVSVCNVSGAGRNRLKSMVVPAACASVLHSTLPKPMD
jgi:hypothetical protein